MRRIVLAMTLLVSACSGGEDVAVAERAIGRFHAELNAGDYARIQAESSPEWRQASAIPETIQLFSGIHNKLGPFVSGKQTGWRVNFGAGGEQILIEYESKFEKGPAVETFNFRRTAKDVQLIGYNINSRALITG